jgi:hypothetical protein
MPSTSPRALEPNSRLVPAGAPWSPTGIPDDIGITDGLGLPLRVGKCAPPACKLEEWDEGISGDAERAAGHRQARAVLRQMWAELSSVPAQMWAELSPVPAQMWQS